MDIVNRGTLTDPALGLELSCSLCVAMLCPTHHQSQSGPRVGCTHQVINPSALRFCLLSQFLLTPRELNAVIALIRFISFH